MTDEQSKIYLMVLNWMRMSMSDDEDVMDDIADSISDFLNDADPTEVVCAVATLVVQSAGVIKYFGIHPEDFEDLWMYPLSMRAMERDSGPQE